MTVVATMPFNTWISGAKMDCSRCKAPNTDRTRVSRRIDYLNWRQKETTPPDAALCEDCAQAGFETLKFRGHLLS